MDGKARRCRKPAKAGKISIPSCRDEPRQKNRRSPPSRAVGESRRADLAECATGLHRGRGAYRRGYRQRSGRRGDTGRCSSGTRHGQKSSQRDRGPARVIKAHGPGWKCRLAAEANDLRNGSRWRGNYFGQPSSEELEEKLEEPRPILSDRGSGGQGAGGSISVLGAGGLSRKNVLWRQCSTPRRRESQTSRKVHRQLVPPWGGLAYRPLTSMGRRLGPRAHPLRPALAFMGMMQAGAGRATLWRKQKVLRGR